MISYIVDDSLSASILLLILLYALLTHRDGTITLSISVDLHWDWVMTKTSPNSTSLT